MNYFANAIHWADEATRYMKELEEWTSHDCDCIAEFDEAMGQIESRCKCVNACISASVKAVEMAWRNKIDED